MASRALEKNRDNTYKGGDNLRGQGSRGSTMASKAIEKLSGLRYILKGRDH